MAPDTKVKKAPPPPESHPAPVDIVKEIKALDHEIEKKA